MSFREWIANNIGYRFLGCFYTKKHEQLFRFIGSKIPKELLNKEISDIGCGDGSNTIRIKKIFRPKKIAGYDFNDFCINRAKENGFEVKKCNMNESLPKGELAAFTFSIHHARDKEKTLRMAVENFDYIFLCEPIRDLYHAVFDAGETLKEKDWIELFNQVLGRYELFRYKSSLIVFWAKRKNLS